MKISREDFLTVSVIVVCFIGAMLLRVPSDKLYESKPRVNPPKALNNFNLGLKIAIADALWLRTLQADDFCETPGVKSANKAVLLEDALSAKLIPSRCNKGWVYHMVDLATDLNPRLTWAYNSGGIMLSIGVDDREGARLIFEKGIAHDDSDWVLLYRAAYHYIFEVQDAKRATEILTLASLHPKSPAIVRILLARLESNAGRIELAKGVLAEYLKTARPGTEGYIHAKARLEQLERTKSFHNATNESSKKEKSP